MRTLAIIQARMASTRLLGKVMLKLAGKPVLQHVIERTQRACSDVIVSTGHRNQNRAVLSLCASLNVPCWWTADDEDDVVSRFQAILQTYDCDVFLRVTADCPLLEPRILRTLMRRMDAAGVDYINGADQAGFADGLGAEIINAETFRRLDPNRLTPTEREHVTPVFYAAESPYSYLFMRPVELNQYRRDPVRFRLTLDTPRDYERLGRMFADIGPEVDAAEAIRWLEAHPEWLN